MQGNTILFIILSGIIALLLALFQYVYRSKINKLNVIFTFLRFVTYFAILLLIINPKFDKVTFYNEKPNLVVATDNSNSIEYLGYDDKVQLMIDAIKNHEDLNNKFNIEFYSFGKELEKLDSLGFIDPKTNISEVFSKLNQVYKSSVSPTVLITDGNQTYGYDYEFSARNYTQPVYSVILGDTITYSDLKIEQLNVNRYAYFKNKFPVEAVINYNGSNSVKTNFVVKEGNQIIFRKPISLSKTNNSKIINLTLPANTVGVISYRAEIVPLVNEKNKINNTKEFGVEIIDQKSNIAIVTDIVHPDIGALKKSIESVEQRSVSILRPNDILNKVDDFDLVILYSPNNTFRAVYNELIRLNKNRFTITGMATDWTFLNSIQGNYFKKTSPIVEEYQPVLNENFSTFIINDLDFQSFPPLNSSFDPVEFKTKSETILFKSVNGIETDQPLLSIMEQDNRREAILFGEGIWRWRAQNFMNEKSFEGFDTFISKLILYLASKDKKKRLNVTNESFYYGNDDIIVYAQYFNKNYEFDSGGNLSIDIKDENSGLKRSFPLILSKSKYQVNLSSLSPSNYSFLIKVNNESLSESGAFKIIEYNVEQQFLNANISKLKRVASFSIGESYFVQNSDALFSDLLKDNRYKTIQKSNKNTVPLIDFKILLFLIALSLSIEWFLRKYNGLI